MKPISWLLKLTTMPEKEWTVMKMTRTGMQYGRKSRGKILIQTKMRGGGVTNFSAFRQIFEAAILFTGRKKMAGGRSNNLFGASGECRHRMPKYLGSSSVRKRNGSISILKRHSLRQAQMHIDKRFESAHNLQAELEYWT